MNIKKLIPILVSTTFMLVGACAEEMRAPDGGVVEEGDAGAAPEDAGTTLPDGGAEADGGAQ